MKFIMATFLIFLCLSIVVGCSKAVEKHSEREAKSPEDSRTADEDKPTPTFTCHLEQYSLQVYGDESPSYFTVLKEGDKAQTLNLKGPWKSNSKIQLTKLASAGDIFAILHEYQDNNHHVYRLFNCSKNLRKEATVDNGYLPIELIAKEDDSGQVIKAYDWWDRDSGARAIAPEIYLVWDGSKFKFDKELMQSLKQNRQDIEKVRISYKAEAAKKNSKWPTVEFEDYLLSLIYSGEAEEAKNLLTNCWPKRKGGKNQFWLKLQAKLKKSKYYSEIKRMNAS